MKALLKFEILQLLRDKKTIFFVFILPTILYPLINGGLNFLTKSQIEKIASEEVTILLDEDFKSRNLLNIDSLKADDILAEYTKIDTSVVDSLLKKYSAVITLKEEHPDSLPVLNIFYSSTTDEQSIKGHRVNETIRKNKFDLIESRYSLAGIKKLFEREKISKENIASLRRTHNYKFSSSLPITLIIVLVLGSFILGNYLILGEKDNRTLELLLASGSSRKRILQSKFIIIFAAGIIISVLELISFYLYAKFGGLADFKIYLQPLQILGFISLTLITSLLITTFSIFFLSRLKSTTAGQILMTPVFIIVLLLSFAGVFDGIEVAGGLYLVPVLNAAALLKKIILDRYDLVDFIVVNLATLIYTFILFIKASHYLNSEDVLTTEEDSERDETKTRKQNMWLAYAIIVVVYYLLGGYWQSENVVFGLLASQIIILGGGTLLIAKINKIPFKRTFKFKSFEFKYIFYALMLGLFVRFPLSYFVTLFSKIFPMPKIFSEAPLPAELLDLNIVSAVFVIALLPALFEEFVYRGVFTELVNKKAIIRSSILIGCMFGFMHLNIFNLVGTSLLGFLLTYLVLKSGSIIPAIIMHFLNNAGSTVLMYLLKDHPENEILKVLFSEDSNPYYYYFTIIMIIVLVMLFSDDLLKLWKRISGKFSGAKRVGFSAE